MASDTHFCFLVCCRSGPVDTQASSSTASSSTASPRAVFPAPCKGWPIYTRCMLHLPVTRHNQPTWARPMTAGPRPPTRRGGSTSTTQQPMRRGGPISSQLWRLRRLWEERLVEGTQERTVAANGRRHKTQLATRMSIILGRMRRAGRKTDPRFLEV